MALISVFSADIPGIYRNFARMTAGNIIYKYFPTLTDVQHRQIDQLDGLYREWNAKINVISRKDIDGLYLHHVLHSMALAQVENFRAGARILDFGTGGGFPGIPLAILFPECRFRLIDGTGKKVKVAGAVAEAIGLENVEAVHCRGEEERDPYDFIVSRAVMPLSALVKIVRKNIVRGNGRHGLLALKGGDLREELRPFRGKAEVTPLSRFFDEEWFEGKYAVFLPL